MRVAVEDEVGTVLEDRRRQPVAAEEDPDLPRLPLQRRLDRRVVEERVEAMQIRVMDLDDILVTKLFALDEHSADYRDLILITRSLREQIDWAQLRDRTAESPFARAFFTLADGLEISPVPVAEGSSSD